MAGRYRISPHANANQRVSLRFWRRYCLRAGQFFAALGEQLRGFRMRNGPSLQVRAGAAISMRQVGGRRDDWRQYQRAKLLPVPKRAGRARRSRWRAYYLVLKGQAFRVVVLKPSVRSVGIREDLEVIWVPDPLARIHVNEHSHRGNPILPPGAAAPTNWEEPAKPRPLASGFGGMSRKLT